MTDVRTSLRPYYITFGVQYSRTPNDLYGTEVHPYWPGADGKGWVRIMARTVDQAHNLARAYFGERYAFVYPSDKFNVDEDRKFYPLGELAVIELGNLAIEGDGPKPVVTTSEPALYGVADNTTIGARIIGRLKEDSAAGPHDVGYDMEYTHPQCYEDGLNLFAELSDVDRNVMAFEMDWAEPWQCAACGEKLA